MVVQNGAAEGPLVGQHVVGRFLRMRWNVARELLRTLGVEVFQGEKRRWFIRVADWDRVKAQLQPPRPPRRRTRGVA